MVGAALACILDYKVDLLVNSAGNSFLDGNKVCFINRETVGNFAFVIGLRGEHFVINCLVGCIGAVFLGLSLINKTFKLNIVCGHVAGSSAVQDGGLHQSVHLGLEHEGAVTVNVQLVLVYCRNKQSVSVCVNVLLLNGRKGALNAAVLCVADIIKRNILGYVLVDVCQKRCCPLYKVLGFILGLRIALPSLNGFFVAVIVGGNGRLLGKQCGELVSPRIFAAGIGTYNKALCEYLFKIADIVFNSRVVVVGVIALEVIVNIIENIYCGVNGALLVFNLVHLSLYFIIMVKNLLGSHGIDLHGLLIALAVGIGFVRHFGEFNRHESVKLLLISSSVRSVKVRHEVVLHPLLSFGVGVTR